MPPVRYDCMPLATLMTYKKATILLLWPPCSRYAQGVPAMFGSLVLLYPARL